MNVNKKRIFGVSEFKTFVSKGVKNEKNVLPELVVIVMEELGFS